MYIEYHCSSRSLTTVSVMTVVTDGWELSASVGGASSHFPFSHSLQVVYDFDFGHDSWCISLFKAVLLGEGQRL